MISVDDLFLEIGDDLIFEDQRRLAAFLEYLFTPNNGWIPPGRNNGRTAAHRERYCLRYYLAKEVDRFAYPFLVEKSERPDFLVIEQGGRRIGVEHTDAGPETYQRWLAQTENQDGVTLYADRQGVANQGVANNDGFVPDASYDEAANDIVSALQNKTASINKFGYQDADSYVLLIYLLSNAPLSFPGDFDAVMARLPAFETVASEGDPRRFDRALVILNDEARYWEPAR